MRFFGRLGNRPVVIVAGWVLAAVLAVLVGVVGIGLVGAGLTTRQDAPITESEAARALSSLGPSAPIETGPAESAPTPAAKARSFPTRGGVVVADCEHIISMAPAQGFAVHEQHRDEGEFRSASDNHDRVRVALTCASGVPQVNERGGDD